MSGSKPSRSRVAGLDDYDVDDSDPFRSPSPKPAASPASQKRKAGVSTLGLDEEVSVKKRARAPVFKLDENLLLSPAGIPRLRQRARKMRLRGRGYEFEDAERMLNMFQFWLDDLYPKARFKDALAMVEKAGHKKLLLQARMEWINDGKSGARKKDDEDHDMDNDDQDDDNNGNDNHDDANHHSTDQDPPQPAPNRPKTPERNDVPNPDDLEDLYDATPRAPKRTIDVPVLAEGQADGHQRTANHAEPGEEDLDALIAEAEGLDRRGHDSVDEDAMAEAAALHT